LIGYSQLIPIEEGADVLTIKTIAFFQSHFQDDYQLIQIETITDASHRYLDSYKK